MMADVNGRLHDHLAFLYGEARALSLSARLSEMLKEFAEANPEIVTAARRTLSEESVSERDTVLITYGDMVSQPGGAPLQTLADFLADHTAGIISSVHVLPFYPYSSDDGFSVIDYQAVNPELGDWEDIKYLGRHFRLMFDAVINHISAKSAWFQGFLQDDPKYLDYFITVEPDADLSQVFRPRALPLLTEVATLSGRKHVWTTFSADQIDLNYGHPSLLFDVIETLLFYVKQGAELIRLDAIGFMWKEIGTSSIHLPQTHRIIQLMRTVLDAVAPDVLLITETNVPHEENISYFGDGTNEAQLVYNFSLPPLTLHAFHSGSAEHLSFWADSLELPSDQVTFFNFTASHDGIGLMPLLGLLDPTAVSAMASRTEALGGNVNVKSNPDGSQSPYELNINYLDALGDPTEEEDQELIARRFLASQAIMLALKGLPGIYFHSLFGSRGWPEGVVQTGRFRTINREKLNRDQLERDLDNPRSLRHLIFNGYRELLQQRTKNPAFHPHGEQQVVFCHRAVFALLRSAPDLSSSVLCLHNVSSNLQRLSIDLSATPITGSARLVNALDGVSYRIGSGGKLELSIQSYGVLWLVPT
jgi:sucrose phosphorylase